jgi:hypothetical protein
MSSGSYQLIPTDDGDQLILRVEQLMVLTNGTSTYVSTVNVKKKECSVKELNLTILVVVVGSGLIIKCAYLSTYRMT